ncbi:hypothetical protein XELAEV_18046569mg [Xenopus laevis]|uniref:G-protein coupled receptors family 1 profile domain-containing protein n=1 Tax=Xenopus laevis TaxID=8355 RepID=A0A974H0Z9_XENLA|nr:hypothetical protein XELAEV_18046569mg [Xenopus laevis]
MTTISGLDVFGESLNLHANFNEISYPIRYISFVLSVLTCALGLVGNALVIWVTGFHMKKHTCKIWFLNLAVADIVFVFCLPLYAVALLTDKWPFGRFLCKVYNYVSTCNMYVSIFIITTLTLDRVLATAKPIWHHKFRSRCICYSTCAVIWIITALSSLPVFFFSDEVIYGKNVQCRLVNVEQSLTTLSIRKRAANYSAGNDTLSTGSILDTLPVLQTSFLTNGILIPALVVGYFIPLFVILISNIIIAKQVKKSKSVKPHRLYVIIITVILFFFLTWTPVVIAQIILLVLHLQYNVLESGLNVNIRSLFRCLVCGCQKENHDMCSNVSSKLRVDGDGGSCNIELSLLHNLAQHTERVLSVNLTA